MKKYLLILSILAGLLFTCERDDICPESTPTTPKLIITFYDVVEQEDAKSVTNLAIQGEDNETVLVYSSTDSIAIPLKTYEDQTTFSFIKDSEFDEENNLVSGNIDVITFTYTRNDVYVSRACGYKTTFENVQSVLTTDTDNWIEIITSEEPLTVDNETAAHIQIFH